jgi:signal transduction histidine kinase
MKLNKHLNKISIKVALVVVLLVVVLFVLLDLVVINRGERVFKDVYGIMTERGFLLPQNEPFIAPAPRDNFQFGFLVPEREMTPPQHFKTRFQSSMILIGLAALLGAVGIGFLIARIVSRPLNKLGTGMKKLRQSHYKFQLEENDSEEFNALIKEFNSLASELNRVEELRKNLISDTSHELRTPLSSLMAQLEGMEDGVIALDKERIKLLREQVDRLSELTEELQDYASLRSQSIKPQLKNFHLKEIINKITEQFKISLAEKKMAVHLNFADDYRLTADEKLIERAFTNLFDNAIRYSKAENININANQEQIIFTDDGVGIPEAHLSDIFERFFRLEKSRSRQTGGLGLGLSIVREIIEAHGWKIKARIPENKKGVEFVIELVNK